ncbi:type II toxin-antitoxin system mRNA interferase toxin, RelE/StbE family [Candidatus Uhrbacteria bacterium]|nr:type II toxin-antitoxin system mRNA interferase toxin, RelE/StbE family [Candidatus Uhrbacteria bacterium]
MPVVILYTPEFKRDYKKLSGALQELLKKKGRVFEIEPFHPLLRTHKLSGKLRDLWSFSLDYRCRVIFHFRGQGEVELLRVGDHSIYRKK